jgi:hypothetical protein
MDSKLPKRVRPHVTRGPARARPLPPLRGRGHAAFRPAPEPDATSTPTPPLLRFTRYGIPALAVLAGIVAMCFGTETSLIGGSGLIGAGIATWLIAWLYRVGVEGDAARDAEERARSYFERHGRWPTP